MNVSKLRQSTVPRDVPTYRGMSYTGGRWPKYSTRIMERFPNGVFRWRGNASCRRTSIRERIFGPIKLISSMSMHCTWRSYSCRCRSGFPSTGCIVWIGMWRAEWIVREFMLKAATLVGASSSNGLLYVEEFAINACCKDFIKEDFSFRLSLVWWSYLGVSVEGFWREK